MILSRALCCLTLLASFGSVPAAAQKTAETGSVIPRNAPAEIPDGRMSQQDRGKITLVRYADCLTDRKVRGVERALTLPTVVEYSKALSNLSVSECLSNGELRFSPVLLRGALFISLYRRDFGRAVPTLVPGPFDFAADLHMSADSPERPQFVALRRFGDCVARADVAAAHAVVTAPIASKRETAGYAAVMPHLGPCLPGGQQFKLNKLMLSSLLAEVLYKQAVRASASLSPVAAK